MKKILIRLLFITLFLLMSYSVLQMPGDIGLQSPAYNEATEYFIEESVKETGAINIIASILTDYRAFDTLGETIVLFTSIIAVISILRPYTKDPQKEAESDG